MTRKKVLTERQRKIKNRRKADREKIKRLLCEQSGRCHWCGEPILSVSLLKKEGTFGRQESPYVYFTSAAGKIVKMLYATIDHLFPVSKDYSPTYGKNIVASCEPCNQKRRNREEKDCSEYS